MLVHPNIASAFLTAYKAMLCAVAGRELSKPSEYADARRLFFERKLIKSPPTDSADLIEALKTICYGDFFLCRHMKRYTEFIGPRDRVYRVKGVTTELSELSPPWMFVRAAVLCFQNEWIADGLVETRDISIGPNMRRDFLAKIRAS